MGSGVGGLALCLSSKTRLLPEAMSSSRTDWASRWGDREAPWPVRAMSLALMEGGRVEARYSRPRPRREAVVTVEGAEGGLQGFAGQDGGQEAEDVFEALVGAFAQDVIEVMEGGV